MGRKYKKKKNILPKVLFLTVILLIGAFPGSAMNAWASEVTAEISVSGNDNLETEVPKVESDVSANEVITEEPAAKEDTSAEDNNSESSESEVTPVTDDTVSDNTSLVGEENLIVQELELPVVSDAKEVFDIELPTLAEESIFNYILDPQGIITATDAIMYGGIPFEEGATLFFENGEGAYGLSSRSDLLQVTNKSTTSVRIYVYAKVTPVDGVIMMPEREFVDESTSLYLALVDEDGTEIPMGTGEEAVLVKELKATPTGIYSLEYNEESGEYEYVLADKTEAEVFDSFSFGLTGACNPKGDWRFVSAIPKVTVTWRVEPIYN